MTDPTLCLPTELSDLLELAVIDAQTFARTKGCALNMRTFGCSTADKCFACMAGAMMFVETGILRMSGSGPLTEEERAVDYMRSGWFQMAGERLGVPVTYGVAIDAQFVLGIWNESLGRYPWAGYMRAVKVLREAGY